MSAEGAAPSRLPVVPVLVVTTATQSLTTLGALALAAMAPKAAADLGVNPALVGYQVGVVYGGAMLAALVGGGCVRRFGATGTSQLAIWLAAAGCAVSALGAVWSLALGALVIGLGYGIVNPASAHLLARTASTAHMNLIFSIKQCGVPIGGILAGLLLPPVALRFGWQAALLLCTAMLAALSATIERQRRAWDADRDPRARALASPFGSVALVWRNKVLRWISLSSFFYAAVQLSATGFMVTYLVAEVGLDLVLAGTILAVANFAGAAGRIVWGVLADRLRSGSVTLIAIGVVCMAGAVATGAMRPDWPVVLIAAAAALFGCSALGWNGVFIAVIARQAPREVGSATGGSLAITYSGIALGPVAFGALHNVLGLSYGTAYLLLAPLTALGVACVVQARRFIRA